MASTQRYVVALTCTPFLQGRRLYQRRTAFPVWAHSQREAENMAQAALAESDFTTVERVYLA